MNGVITLPAEDTFSTNSIEELGFAVFKAVQNNRVDSLQELIHERTIWDKIFQSSGKEAFNTAALRGHLEVIKWFLQKADSKQFNLLLFEGSPNALTLILGHGHMDVLAWLEICH